MTHLAQRLHDGVAQDLWFANVQVRLLRTALNAGAADTAVAIAEELQTTLERSVQEVRSVLKEPGLDDPEADLTDLRVYADHLRKAGGPRIVLETHLAGPAPDRLISQLAWIAREALTNAYKHSRARRIDAAVVVGGGLATLVVADDGRGFDPDQSGSGDRFGLRSMQTRAESLGGTLAVRSCPERGTIVQVTVPVTESTPSRNRRVVHA